MAFPFAAIISLAGDALSKYMSYRNNKKMEAAQEAEDDRRAAYYDARANEDPLSRSEARQAMGQYDRDAERQVERARNVSTITGATPEYSAAVQKAVAEGRANLMGNIYADASERADKFRQKSEDARHKRATNELARLNARNETYANLAANAANAFGSIIDSYAPKDTTTDTPDVAAKAPALNTDPSAPENKVEDATGYYDQNKKKEKTGLGVYDSNTGIG